MEHVITSNIMAYLDKHNLLHPNQHGFHKNLICETQFNSLKTFQKTMAIRTTVMLITLLIRTTVVPKSGVIGTTGTFNILICYLFGKCLIFGLKNIHLCF